MLGRIVVCAIVVVMLAACSEVESTEKPAPSATPTETPAPQPTPTPTTEVSTREIVSDACSKMDHSDSYDIAVTTINTAIDEVLLMGIKVSGEDFEVTWTMKGETMPYSQFRRIDGVDYLHDGLAWRYSEVPLDDISTMYRGLTMPCPSTAAFREIGTETLDGKETTRYTETEESLSRRAPWDFLVGVIPTPRSMGMWLDANGQIVQHYEVTDFKDNFTSRENPRLWTTTTRSVFSDVGQANTITAPPIPQGP